MKNKINYIIREVPPEQTEFSFYFDDDGLTAAGGDYCYNLFIVAQSRNSGGFNEKEYANIQNEIENLLEMYSDIVDKSNYAQYPSIGAMLKDYKLIDNIHNTKRIKAFTALFADCKRILGAPYTGREKFEAHNAEMTAEYLTLKTGKEWDTVSAYGYCQGDQVVVVYCKEHYTDGAKQYGEVWLGAAEVYINGYLYPVLRQRMAYTARQGRQGAQARQLLELLRVDIWPERLYHGGRRAGVY